MTAAMKISRCLISDPTTHKMGPRSRVNPSQDSNTRRFTIFSYVHSLYNVFYTISFADETMAADFYPSTVNINCLMSAHVATITIELVRSVEDQYFIQ